MKAVGGSRGGVGMSFQSMDTSDIGAEGEEKIRYRIHLVVKKNIVV